MYLISIVFSMYEEKNKINNSIKLIILIKKREKYLFFFYKKEKKIKIINKMIINEIM